MRNENMNEPQKPQCVQTSVSSSTDIEKWIKTTEKRPTIGMSVEYSNDGEEVEGTLIYTDERTCMMAGSAGGYGYFGEGFATDGDNCDYGLICGDPEYWREI